MKKIGIFMSSLMLSSSLLAQGNGVYMGVGLGIEAMPKAYDDGVGLALKGGVGLDRLLPHLGVEAELSSSLASPETPGGEKIDIVTGGLYATYTIAIPGSPFSVRPKFGLILPNLSDDIHSRDVAISGGIAGVLEFSRQLDLYLEYVNTSETMNNYVLGLQVNF